VARRSTQARADERGVYVDHLERWAWYVDSRGNKSKRREIFSPDDRLAVEAELQTELDEHDAIPASEFVPAPLRPERRLRLL
jgi:hypothetical protein